jgi:hypothetical protein
MEGANPMWPADEPVAQPESQGTPGKENPESADEVYIPDYVMLDFGLPKEREPAGGHLSDSVG